MDSPPRRAACPSSPTARTRPSSSAAASASRPASARSSTSPPRSPDPRPSSVAAYNPAVDLFDPPPSAIPAAPAPLADRIRPRTLDEVVGQQHLIGPGKVLRRALEEGQLHSMILWGPPGTGKTTLAFLMAQVAGARFVPFSAVLAGVKEIRQVVAEAQADRARGGKRTILFVDEIHRFNKGQQDAFLPHVEKGTLTLIGATTENPSFEVNAALLSRCRVYTLQPLSEDDIVAILERALRDPDRGLGATVATADTDSLRLIARLSGGAARGPRRQGVLSLPGLARGRARAGPGDLLPGARAEVQRGLRRVESGQAGHPGQARRARAAPPPQCPDRAHGQPGLRQGLSVRA